MMKRDREQCSWLIQVSVKIISMIYWVQMHVVCVIRLDCIHSFHAS